MDLYFSSEKLQNENEEEGGNEEEDCDSAEEQEGSSVEEDCDTDDEQQGGNEEEDCDSADEQGGNHGSDDTSDEEYKQPTDEDSSAEDEEVIELRRFAKEIKRNIKAKKFGLHGSQLREIKEKALVVAEVPNLENLGSPICDSSDEYSYEENSEGEIERWKSQ